ncbi:MAG: IS1380 family transposase [Pirellulales bacterium]
MTDCSARELRFRAPSRHELVARFDGGDITSDGGALLLRAADDRLRLCERLAGCFTDHRDPERVEHTTEELVRQRVFGLALGYEDLVDHDELRRDPLLASLVGKRDPKGRSRRERDRGMGLAGSRTLNRLELGTPAGAASDRYRRIAMDHAAVDRLCLDVFLESFDEEPDEIILDFDATDDQVHGKQEGRFFHGYYDHHCYLPLYIFSGEHLLCARLRRANQDAAAGSLEELERIVGGIRERWPNVTILVRADSGFCREWLMAWCEENAVAYLLGLARNDRLEERLAPMLGHAADLCRMTGKPARLFDWFQWSTLSSWSRERQVIGKAEHLPGRSNPRFIVTNLPVDNHDDARRLYEEVYCARGDMENRIKEQQLDLFADRTSSHTMHANQVRLSMASMAYVLVSAIRRLALAGTELSAAQCGTIRTKLLKIGARVKVTVRRVWVHLASGYPWADSFVAAWLRLRPT